MTAPTVLVDIDGVLAEFNRPFLALLNRCAAANNEPQQADYAGHATPQVWHWFEPAGFSKRSVSAAWDFVKRYPEWWGNLRAYPGAVDFLVELEALRDAGRITPYFVTSRPNQLVAAVTSEWLSALGFARPNVIVVSGPGAKGKIADAVSATAILDDHGPNFEGMPVSTRCFLLDRPWNQQDRYDTRITELEEFLRLVRTPEIVRSFAPEAA